MLWTMDDPKARHQVAHSRFGECKAAGNTKWGILKTGQEAAWSDLETAFNKLGKSSVEANDAQLGKTEPQAKTE